MLYVSPPETTQSGDRVQKLQRRRADGEFTEFGGNEKNQPRSLLEVQMHPVKHPLRGIREICDLLQNQIVTLTDSKKCRSKLKQMGIRHLELDFVVELGTSNQ